MNGEVPEHSPLSGGKGRGWPNLFRNLRCGIRMALLRRVKEEDFRTAAGDLVFLAVSDLVSNLMVSFLLVGRDGALNYSALPSFFFHLPLMLLFGLLAGRLMSRPALVTLVPVALISLSIPVEICHGLLEGMTHLPRLGWLENHLEAPYYYRFYWWWTAGAILFMFRLAEGARPRRAVLLVSFAAIISVPLALFPRNDLWVSGNQGGESGELRLTEEVLAVQSHLLDDQMDRLTPGREDGPHLYFVGFAGDATQDVFMREMTAVERIFADRFGTAGRSLLLVNNPNTATTLPFATASNLERALVRLGRIMNRDNDVLFLYLTSHGSPEHVLAVENGPLELDGLTPEMVRRMFEKSGITWKVLVVSACYAGGFIEPLKEEHTLIVTAADAVSESFGCSLGEKYTWFGKAYFDEALAGTYSFSAAFAKARNTIGRWEKEQGEKPSNPQIWIGTEMKIKLGQLEKRLEAGGGTRSGQAR